MNKFNCLICRDTIKYKVIFKCCKSFTCIECLLKINSKEDDIDFKCSFCKMFVNLFYVTKNLEQEVFIEGSLFYKIKNLIFYLQNKDVLNFFESKFLIDCKLCNYRLKDNKEIIFHYKSEHDLLFCNLCLENKYELIDDLDLYNKEELNKHLNDGNLDKNGMRIYHPFCKFCKQYFYNEDSLLKHLKKNHEICLQCKNNYVFYKNTGELFDHIKNYHYQCHYKNCENVNYFVSVKSFERHLDFHHSIIYAKDAITMSLSNNMIKEIYEINQIKVLKKTFKLKDNSMDFRKILLKFKNSYLPSYLIKNFNIKDKPNPLYFIFSNEYIINNPVKVEINNFNEIFIPKLDFDMDDIFFYFKNYLNKEDFKAFEFLMEHFKKSNTIIDKTDDDKDTIFLCNKVYTCLERYLNDISLSIWLIQIGLVFINESKGTQLISLGFRNGKKINPEYLILINFKCYNNFFMNIYKPFKLKIKKIIEENPSFKVKKEDITKIMNLREFIRSSNFVDLFNYVIIKNFLKKDKIIDYLKSKYFDEKYNFDLGKISITDFIILFLFFGFLLKKLNNYNYILENKIEFENLIDIYSLIENNDSDFINKYQQQVKLKIHEKKLDIFDFPTLIKPDTKNDENVLKNLLSNKNDININNKKKVKKTKYNNNIQFNNNNQNKNKNNNRPVKKDKINEDLIFNDNPKYINNVTRFNPIKINQQDRLEEYNKKFNYNNNTNKPENNSSNKILNINVIKKKKNKANNILNNKNNNINSNVNNYNNTNNNNKNNNSNYINNNNIIKDKTENIFNPITNNINPVKNNNIINNNKNNNSSNINIIKNNRKNQTNPTINNTKPVKNKNLFCNLLQKENTNVNHTVNNYNNHDYDLSDPENPIIIQTKNKNKKRKEKIAEKKKYDKEEVKIINPNEFPDWMPKETNINVFNPLTNFKSNNKNVLGYYNEKFNFNNNQDNQNNNLKNNKKKKKNKNKNVMILN